MRVRVRVLVICIIITYTHTYSYACSYILYVSNSSSNHRISIPRSSYFGQSPPLNVQILGPSSDYICENNGFYTISVWTQTFIVCGLRPCKLVQNDAMIISFMAQSMGSWVLSYDVFMNMFDRVYIYISYIILMRD